MSRCTRQLIATLALAALSAVVCADNSATRTYRWVDAQGVVHYSDTPQPGAVQIQIAPVQTYSAPPTQTAPQSPTSSVPQLESAEACVITAPQSDQSLYAPETLHVSVQLAPALRDAAQVAVSLDGKLLEPQDTSRMRFQVDTPDRGSHTVTVAVRDAGGNTLCNGKPVTFYVERPSVLSPQSPARGH